MPFLTTTLHSHSSGKLYAHQNDEVSIVSLNGHVAIVESALGNRFPVLVELLGEERIGYPPKENAELKNLESAFTAQIKKSKAKFNALYLAVKDGLINKEMPKNITKELWLQTAESLLKK